MVSIPETKINAFIQKTEDALQHTKVALKQLQSLIGSLSFVCKAISPGRPFIRRLIDLTCGVVKSWYKISDLNMWILFLKEFNGVSIIPDQVSCDELQFFTDASGGIGFGGGYLSRNGFRGGGQS